MKKKKKKHTRKYPKRAKPYREREYDMYVLWKSLPTLLKGQKLETFGKLGISDELLVELLSIKSQTEFAKHFGIPEPTTLSDWNKRPDLVKQVEAARKSWSKKLTSNVMMGLYRKAVQEGDASRVKLWMQIVEGWVEKTQHTHEGEVKTNLSMNDLLNAMRDYENESKK